MEKISDIPSPIIVPHASTDWHSTVDYIVSDIADCGWSVVTGVFAPTLLHALTKEVHGLNNEGALALANVGRGGRHVMEPSIRQDKTQWLTHDTKAQGEFLNQMEQFRLEINRQLMLGLFSYEAHFAVYEPGAFYKRHLDSFKGAKNRIISTVLYLNETWYDEDGGALALYRTEQKGEQPFATIPPVMGTLVVFLSEDIPHEVMTANRRRASIAGWFRCREEVL